MTEPSAAGQAYHVQELLIPLLPLLLRLLREGRSRRLSKPEKRFQAGLKYVQAHHAEPSLRLEDAARACGLSACYFSALFSQAVGYRFTDYVTECRLRHACALLSSSPVSVTEAAYESGFSSLPHFFRCFKSRFGCSPGCYRKQAAEALSGGSADPSFFPFPLPKSDQKPKESKP